MTWIEKKGLEFRQYRDKSYYISGMIEKTNQVCLWWVNDGFVAWRTCPRSVLDRSIPLIMAMVDIAAEEASVCFQNRSPRKGRKVPDHILYLTFLVPKVFVAVGEAQLRSTLNLILLLQCLHQAVDPRSFCGVLPENCAFCGARPINLGEVRWRRCRICTLT